MPEFQHHPPTMMQGMVVYTFTSEEAASALLFQLASTDQLRKNAAVMARLSTSEPWHVQSDGTSVFLSKSYRIGEG